MKIVLKLGLFVLLLLIARRLDAAEPVDAKSFAFARPFVESLGEGMSCQVHYQSGQIRIEVTLPDQRLVPRRGTGLPAGEKTGPWQATFLLVPKLEAADLTGIGAMSQLSDSKDIPSDPVYADIAAGSHWYRIRYCSYAPGGNEGQQKVEAFVERLSQRVTDLAGKDAGPVLSRLLGVP